MSMYRTLQDAALADKRVLLRAGFDVKIENNVVVETERIEALVPTMRFILDHGASLVILSHQGRPKGKPDPEFTQRPLVPVLETLLGRSVQFAPTCTGPETHAMAAALKPGEVLLIENLRFDPREEANDETFAKELSQLGDVYVNDAFTNCHRAHASMVALAQLLPAYAGLQLEKELTHLTEVVEHPRTPVVLVVSGAKMETKLPVIEFFLDKGDDILLGGCIANTFIAAGGAEMGTSKYEPDLLPKAHELIDASGHDGKAMIHVPRDVVAAPSSDEPQRAVDVSVDEMRADLQMLDIGSATAERYAQTIERAGTIIWNGPLGYYEVERFAKSSMVIAEAIVRATANGALSVIGGGDTIDFHTRYNHPLNAYTFVSTGGGTMLEFLAGNTLPALGPLRA